MTRRYRSVLFVAVVAFCAAERVGRQIGGGPGVQSWWLRWTEEAEGEGGGRRRLRSQEKMTRVARRLALKVFFLFSGSVREESRGEDG